MKSIVCDGWTAWKSCAYEIKGILKREGMRFFGDVVGLKKA